MSVSLEVEKGKPFQIGTILPMIEKALKVILGLTYEPKVMLDFVRSAGGDTDLQELAWIRPGVEEGFSITLSGERAEVRVHSREGVGYFAILPEKWWSAALGAAVAIAIAEHSASEVCDTGSIYTLKEYSNPDEFAQSIKVDKVFDKIKEAIEYFFSRLPGAAKKENGSID